MGASQRTADAISACDLAGPVVSDLAEDSTEAIAQMDARWAAVVLAGQAIDYAVSPGPSAALADVLRMTGLTQDVHPFGWTL